MLKIVTFRNKGLKISAYFTQTVKIAFCVLKYAIQIHLKHFLNLHAKILPTISIPFNWDSN